MSMTCFLSRHRSLRPQAVTGTGTHLDSSCSVGDLTPMCNRFRSIKEWSDLPRRFHGGPRLNFEFNPNVAPTELVPILVAGQGVVLARFGINRLGSGDKPRPPLLNVRTDGMRKGQFRKHLKERRCVIPCEGFYEWRDEGGKQPYYFSRKDGKPLMLAGIWEISEYKGDSRVAFAILTDEPNELVASYHDRMPLSLADDKVDVWLDLANESPLGGDLLLDLKEFTVRPMDRAMNNVRQKNLAAIDPEAAAA
jgi:putative SOS response-associated peptidase YedK